MELLSSPPASLKCAKDAKTDGFLYRIEQPEIRGRQRIPSVLPLRWMDLCIGCNSQRSDLCGGCMAFSAEPFLDKSESQHVSMRRQRLSNPFWIRSVSICAGLTVLCQKHNSSYCSDNWYKDHQQPPPTSAGIMESANCGSYAWYGHSETVKDESNPEDRYHG